MLNGFAPLTLLRDPAAYAVAAAGIVSFVFYATALEGGSVTVATAAVVLAETLPPAVIGVLFLGDTTRPGLAPVAVVGFAARGGERGHARPVRRGRSATPGPGRQDADAAVEPAAAEPAGPRQR